MISIVIPNYNCANLLEKNLPTLIKLLDQSKLEYEIIICDDASTDNSLEMLKKFQHDTCVIPAKAGIYKKINYKLSIINSKLNTGFGANVDRGIRESVGEIVFILNAIDLLPEKSDYFKLMLDHFKNKDVFSVGALKREKDDHGCGEIYFEKGFYLHRRRHPGAFSSSWSPVPRHPGTSEASDRIYSGKKILSAAVGGFQNDAYTDWADGGAQAIRKEYYEKIGGFDPKYFLYWEDVDLGFRAWKAGYKIVFEPKAVLIHQKNEGPIAKRFSENEIRKLNIKNQIYFTWKNSDLKHKLLFLFWLPYHLAISLKNHDWLFFKAIISPLAPTNE